MTHQSTYFTRTGRGDWMQTYRGGAFYPLDPRPEEVDSLDIANGLSMVCRYAGQVNRFYSVAEHCVLMSEQMPDDFSALWALLHDAAEAYVGDLVRPIKHSLDEYCEVEDRIMNAVRMKFDLTRPCPPVVHAADNRIILDERAVLLSKSPQPWGELEQLEPLGVTIHAWNPSEAKKQYLRRLFTLWSPR